jgi:hypothetical protein
MMRSHVLRNCIDGLVAFEDRFDTVSSKDAAWICERLTWHKLLPLAANLDDPDKPKCPELAACFHSSIIKNAIRERQYESQVRGIFRMFDEAALEYMPYKGPFWMQNSYPDYSWRHIGDIDIIMPNDAARKAAALLKEEGYFPIVVGASEDADFERRGELTLFNDPSRTHEVPVQLHWSPLPSPRFYKKDLMLIEAFKHGATIEEWKGLRFLVPPPETQFLYYILHATCQHQFLRFSHIMAPIHCMVKTPCLDWDSVYDLAAEGQALIPLLYGLKFIQKFYPLPEGARRLMERLSKPTTKTWLAAACLSPNSILFATRKRGGYRRKIFRAAMSW